MTTEVWEELDTETSKAYHAFEHYRDLPPFGRSMKKAWEEHTLNCDPFRAGRPTPRNWEQWSSDHEWVKRVISHDRDISRTREKKRRSELNDAEDRISRVVRGAFAGLIPRIAGMDFNDIPVASIPAWIRTLSDVELKVLGHEERAAETATGPMIRELLVTFAEDLGEDELEAQHRRLEALQSEIIVRHEEE